MTDYDLEAAANARLGAKTLTQDFCLSCTKPMYREAAYPGVATEWRHRSSGHAISYLPSKHIAGLAVVGVHQHRWGEAAEDKSKSCTVIGCDSLLIARIVEPPEPEPERSDKAQREHESRKRGAVKGHETAASRAKVAREKKHGRQIPF